MDSSKIVNLSKRQKFVLAVFLLSAGLFISESFPGIQLALAAVFLSVMTVLFLYFILQEDIRETFYYPLFILPFFFTLSFIIFYPLVPARLISKLVLTALYAFGLYSLFLTQNIFAVSASRTINLLRSARIVLFVITILILFFLINFIFSLRLPILLTPFIISIVVLILSFQSLWSYSLEKKMLKEIAVYSSLIAFSVMQLSFVLAIWPVTAAIYTIFLTGIFYMYLGLAHAWITRRLFRGILWEYIWVGFLSILILIVFSEWGL